MRSAILNISLLLALSLSGDLSAHGGGTNSYGCHNQSSTSTHHCHSGDYNGLSFSSQDAFLTYVKEQSESTTAVTTTTDSASVDTTEVSTSAITVRVITSLGDFSIELFDDVTPVTVANFLNYVNSGRFNGTVIHRSVSNFIIQGGSFSFDASINNIASVATDAAIQNEFSVSNTRGTVAMAKLGGDPNSATSGWFVNLADNSGNLDSQNGGFTVFGRVIGDGMTVVDSIAAQPTYTLAGLTDFPLINYVSGAVVTSNFVTVTTSVVSTYNRDDYLSAWGDDDGDCINTRHEVLIIESLVPVTMNDSGCLVSTGEWYDPITGQTFTESSDVDIDHHVALSEAHRSGADVWPSEEKKAFANDLLNSFSLQAMDDSTNSSKSDKDPANWLPPNESHHCDYVKNWVEVKSLYNLTYDDAEKVAIEGILGTTIDYGARKSVAGLLASTAAPTGRFSLGITNGTSCGYSSAGSVFTSTLIDFSITPSSDHLNQTVDIIIVAVLGSDIYSISDKLQLVPYTGDATKLAAFIPSTTFQESRQFEFIQATFNDPLSVSLYLAYRLESGDLVYSPEPFTVTVK